MKKKKKIEDLIEASLDTILYSKYYWCTQFVKRFCELYGKDVSMEQQQYKIMEEMGQRLVTIDWNLIEMITKGSYK